jgi:hypothetical protein
MSLNPCDWLVLLIIEDESDRGVKQELDECGLYISPDRWNEIEGWLKWNVGGYSGVQIERLKGRIEKQLMKIGGLKYEFYCE